MDLRLFLGDLRHFNAKWMSSTNKGEKVDYSAPVRGRKRDNPRHNFHKVNSFALISILLDRHRIQFQSLRDLYLICEQYILYGLPSKRNRLLNGQQGGYTVRSIQLRLKGLEERGLITRNGYDLYPTDLALQELKHFLEKPELAEYITGIAA